MANLVYEGAKPFGKEEAMPEGYDKSKVTTLEDIKKRPKPVLGALALGGVAGVPGYFLGRSLRNRAIDAGLIGGIGTWKNDPIAMLRTQALSKLPHYGTAALGIGGYLLGLKLLKGLREKKEPEPAL